jgi:hypothetical protein
MSEKSDIDKIATYYNGVTKIWNTNDKWHYKTFLTINQFIGNCISKYKIPKSSTTINLGSGGNPYCFDEENMLHIDIATNHIVTKNKFLISNIEKIDVPNSLYDCCLCVGSVINYCSAALSIKEMERVMKNKSYLFLEFENSRSFEFFGTKDYHKSAVKINTFYRNNIANIWVYSEDYILQFLKINGFKIILIKRFHILSPLIYRLTKNSNFASNFLWLDNLIRYIPFIGKHSSNIILLAQKHKET